MTPTNLKSARKALGKSMQGLAEDLGYSGKHAWKNIQLMENGTRPIPGHVCEGLVPLLWQKACDAAHEAETIRAASEPTGATHSEKRTLTGVVGVVVPSGPCDECGAPAGCLCRVCQQARDDDG